MVAGSEMAGGVEWVFSHNNKYDSPNLYFGLRVKTNSSRGGYLRHVYMRDTEVKALMAAFMTFNFYYDNDSDTRVPAVSDIYVSNCYSPEGGFTNKPKLGLIMGKQYGSSPISGVHLKNCVFEGFHQSPASGANPNRPVTNLVCVEEGGIDYDNVRLDGELYSPPAKSVRISKLIFTNASTGEARDILTPEHIEALIKESRRGKTSWDISAVAEIKGFDYKGKHYDVSDTIDNSTYSGPLGGAARNPSVMPEKYNGGVLYVNGRSPHVKEEDKEFPHYKASGMPAYEAFVRVGTNIPVNDWTTDSETFETGPNYAVDLRAPGRVAHIGGNEYLIKLREDVAMGGTTPGRASGFNSLNKVEIVVRNALYNEDQDFVFYSALPRITGTSLDPAKRAFTVNFDRPMKGVDISPWKFSLSTGAGALIAMSGGEWSGDGASVAYTISGAVSPDGAYSFNAFDPTSQFMSYRGGVRLTGAGGEERDGGGGCDAGYAGAAFIAAAATAAFWKKAIWKKKF
jgi:hypothetical protein